MGGEGGGALLTIRRGFAAEQLVPVTTIAITSIPECWRGVISQWGRREREGRSVGEKKQ